MVEHAKRWVKQRVALVGFFRVRSIWEALAIIGFLGIFWFLWFFAGLPTAISISGGLVVLCFGSLWPIMWVASLLPAEKVSFLHSQHEPIAGEGEKPYITILAPARNEEPVAERLVRQFLGQSYENFQLIVIANNCTDNTAEVARAAANGDPRILVVEATFPNGVKADALNYGLERYADGDVVLELDSDNEVPPDLLHKLALAFSDPKVDAVQTQIRAYNAKGSLLATFQDLEFLIYSEVWNRGRAAFGLSSSIGGTGFAARTYILRELHGWTRDLVEDFEMHTRLVMRGVAVTYLPWACVYDEKPVTWGAIIKQRKRWIRGHLEVAARLSKSGEPLGLVDRFYLYSPLIIALMLGLFAMGNLSLVAPKLIPGYAYFSPWFWFASIVLMVSALITTAVRSKSYHLVPLVFPYLLFFTFHWVVVLVSSLMPVSWAHSKTVHGVETSHGFLPWIGIDAPAAARKAILILVIAVLWQAPLWQGLQAAPSPLKAPVLTAKRSKVAWIVNTALAAGIVEGYLYRTNGNPMPGAWVEIVGSDGVTYRTKSDNNGYFYFASIPSGTTQITINKGSWPTATTSFDMPTNTGVDISGTLNGSGTGIVVTPIPY